jgi:signal transduction histidine kinase
LVLAQVSEPRYRLSQTKVNIQSLLGEEVEGLPIKTTADGARTKKISMELPDDDCEIVGDAHLLRRMVRNILVNAMSFAREKIVVRLEPHPHQLEIIFEDDGPGFNDEALHSFGERRISRMLASDPGLSKRLSVGLGSVIVKTVAQLHRGTVQVSNRRGPDGSVAGARVKIELPT